MSRRHKLGGDANRRPAWSVKCSLNLFLCVLSANFVTAAEPTQVCDTCLTELERRREAPCAGYLTMFCLLQTRCIEGRWWGPGVIGQDSLLIAARSATTLSCLMAVFALNTECLGYH